MKSKSSNNLVRIKADGPFFNLDFEVPEKKATKELKQLKNYVKQAISKIKQEAEEKAKRYERRAHRYVLPDWYEFKAQEHGITPTTITVTKVQ